MKNLILAGACALLAQGAFASTGYYLVSTYPYEGQRTVDVKYWSAKPSGQPSRSSPEIGFGYNVNSRWYTEVVAAWSRQSPGSNTLSAFEWQNDFMLTQGEYPFDLALHTTVVRNRDSARGVGFEFGPVIQTEVGRTQLNFNLFFERDYRAAKANRMQAKYQWQVRRHWRPKLDFGMQGFGEMGDWNDWLPSGKQSHRAGPALFGNWNLGDAREWKYEAAYLIGKNSARNAKSVTMRIQYAF